MNNNGLLQQIYNPTFYITKHTQCIYRRVAIRKKKSSKQNFISKVVEASNQLHRAVKLRMQYLLDSSYSQFDRDSR